MCNARHDKILHQVIQGFSAALAILSGWHWLESEIGDARRYLYGIVGLGGVLTVAVLVNLGLWLPLVRCARWAEKKWFSKI